MPSFLIVSATTGNNLKLAELLAPIAQAAGADTELVRLPNLELPLYVPGAEESGIPEAAKSLTAKLDAADALVLLAPEYNGSIPPIVSNAIAWMSLIGDDFRKAFNGKFAVVGTHSGGAGFKITEAMRSQLNHLGMIVLARTFTTSYQKEQSEVSAKAIFEQLVGLTSK